jgi:hypothetical protein
VLRAAISVPSEDEPIKEFERRMTIFKRVTKTNVHQDNLSSLAVFSFKNVIASPETPEDLIKQIRARIFGPEYVYDRNVFEKAFEHKYEDPNKVLLRFLQHLECECVGNWTDSEYYAAYLSLVQSSGTGKTRLLKELAIKEKVFVAYACLRTKKDSGYPTGTSKIVDRFSAPLKTMTFVFYILAVLEYLETTPDVDPSSFFSSCQDSNSDYWNKVCAKVIESESKYRLHGRNGTERNEIDENKKKIADAFAKFAKKYETTRNGPLRLLFAFDEAMLLSVENGTDASIVEEGPTPLVYLRRALTLFPRSKDSDKGMFAVFTDTSSRVSVLSPENRYDFSFRARVGGMKLFAPFYFTQLDIMREDTPSTTDVFNLVSLEQLARYGRPLWYTTYISGEKTDSEGATEERLIQLAVRKILAGREINIWAADKTEILSHYAVLCARFCIEAEIEVSMSEHLVSGYMAILSYISPERDIVISRFPSEPILAEAAAQCMWKIGPEKLFNTYASLLKKLPAGETGELAARVLVQFALDCIDMKSAIAKIDQGLAFTRTNSVYDFLKSIMGKRPFPANLEWTKTAYLCFNHFSRVFYACDKKAIEEALKACMAIICQPNEYGVDLILPIHHGTTYDSESVDAIFVQVKNRTTEYSDKEVVEKLQKSYRRILGQPDKTLFIAISLLRDDDLWYAEEDKTLFLDGLSSVTYAFLSDHPQLVTSLKTVVQHTIDLPEKQEDGRDKALICAALPRNYMPRK